MKNKNSLIAKNLLFNTYSLSLCFDTMTQFCILFYLSCYGCEISFLHFLLIDSCLAFELLVNLYLLFLLNGKSNVVYSKNHVNKSFISFHCLTMHACFFLSADFYYLIKHFVQISWIVLIILKKYGEIWHTYLSLVFLLAFSLILSINCHWCQMTFWWATYFFWN